MTAKERPSAIVVLGMHRSGTSAVAGALVQRGAEAGDALLPSTSDNANGYFEDARLVAASDALLAARGAAWDEPGPLPPFERQPGDAPAFSAMEAVFRRLAASDRPVVVKDPRACRLVPAWTAALQAAGLAPVFLIVLRDPREVAASLATRDGMAGFRAHQLWLEHLLDAERATRTMPRAFLDFSALLASPDATLDAALATLGLEGALAGSGGAAAVDPALRRQRAGAASRQDLADELFAFARTLAGGSGTTPEARGRFDAFRARWLERAEAARAALDDAKQREAQAGAERLRVARAVGGAMALASAACPAPPRVPVPRVYWCEAGAEHSEDRSCRATPDPLGHGFVARVPATRGRWGRLRLDPDDQAGAYALRGLVVGGRAMPAPMRCVVAANGLLRPLGEDGLLVYASDDDPWVEFDLEASPGPFPQEADLELRFDVQRRELPDLLWTLVEQEAFGKASVAALSEAQEGMAADLRTHGAAIAQLRGELVAAREDAARERAIERARWGQLDAVRGDTREMLGWMRRRTLRYWWQRLFGPRPGAPR